MSERWMKGLLPVVFLVLGGVASAAPAPGGESSTALRCQVDVGRELDRTTRSLVDPAPEFPADVGKVYCLARVIGAAAPTEVTFVWYHLGRTMARVSLPVRSGDYRTWSSKNIMPAWTGSWEVKVLDPMGQVVGETSFLITDGETGAD